MANNQPKAIAPKFAFSHILEKDEFYKWKPEDMRNATSMIVQDETMHFAFVVDMEIKGRFCTTTSNIRSFGT